MEWNEMNLEQKKKTYAKHIGYEIVQSISKDRAPFLEQRDFSEQERAFNPTNGIAYNNLNSLILDIKQKEGNYQSNQWISLQDAKFLGADQKEIDQIYSNAYRKDNPQGIPRAQISYIKESELRYVKKCDKNGNPIPLLDENGNQRVSSKSGELLFEYEMVPQKNQNGEIRYKENGEPFMDFKKERVKIDPVLVVESLFNIDEFKTIDKNKLKPINKDTIFRHITKHKDGFDHSKSNLILEDLRGIVYPETLKTIANYLYTQNALGKFEPSIANNEAKKQQEKINAPQTQTQSPSNEQKSTQKQSGRGKR